MFIPDANYQTVDDLADAGSMSLAERSLVRLERKLNFNCKLYKTGNFILPVDGGFQC